VIKRGVNHPKNDKKKTPLAFQLIPLIEMVKNMLDIINE